MTSISTSSTSAASSSTSTRPSTSGEVVRSWRTVVGGTDKTVSNGTDLELENLGPPECSACSGLTPAKSFELAAEPLDFRLGLTSRIGLALAGLLRAWRASSACSRASSRAGGPPPALAGLLRATVSAYAVNTKTGDLVLSENADKSLMPASCIKAITTAWLAGCGPERGFRPIWSMMESSINRELSRGISLFTEGAIRALALIGLKALLLGISKSMSWVEAVEKLGIKKIEGQVVGDASRWEKALASPSWIWEDLGNYYGAGACALFFHENLYTLTFKPGKEGEKTTVLRLDPPIAGLTLENEVTTGPAGSGDRACIYGSEYSQIQHVRGTIPAGVEEFSIKGAIPDPASFCGNLFARALEAKGISIGHQKLDPAKRTVFHTTVSPRVKDIVYWTNQKSINLYAEHLLKKMGEVVFNEGSTKAGIKAVTDFWLSKNIDLAGFNMADGSGLSRKNLVTAKQFVSILSQVKKSDVFPVFLRSLRDEADHVKAKDGGMSLVRGYVGYADDVVFAIFVNQCLDPKMSKKMQALLSGLAPAQPRNLNCSSQ